MKKIVVAIAAFALVAAMAPAASAGCFPDKIFGQMDPAIGVYNYLLGYDPAAPVVGAFWQPGTRALNNEGGYDASQWIGAYFAGNYYAFGFLGNAAVVGCPAGSMALMVTQDLGTTATFAAMQATENAAVSTVFLYDNVQMTEFPRPRVTASSRDVTNVTVDISFDALDAGYASLDNPGEPTTVISDIVLYTAKGADPGRGVGGWTLHSVIPYTGGITSVVGVTIDCSDVANNTQLAAGIRATGEYDTQHVSAATAIECDSTLADPDDVSKFDLIRERGEGQKKGKPFRDN